MPLYIENPLIIPFSMLCPGISQNTKHHHLTLYNGQVWEEKPYLELCNHNVLYILHDISANFNSVRWPIMQNDELHVPPVPGVGFTLERTQGQIPWDSEILQSFAGLTNITNMKFISDVEIFDIENLAADLDPSDSGIILKLSRRNLLLLFHWTMKEHGVSFFAPSITED